METIMVAAGERQWTLGAMHLACALARNMGKDLVLVQMVSVSQPSYLGANFAHWNDTAEDQARMRDYVHTAEDYGVNLSVTVFEYINFVPGLAQAAEHADADVVFATLPNSAIPYLRRLRLWNLRRELKRRTLYTLDPDTRMPEWKPAITVVTAQKEAIR
jgi:hypothetical protein